MNGCIKGKPCSIEKPKVPFMALGWGVTTLWLSGLIVATALQWTASPAEGQERPDDPSTSWIYRCTEDHERTWDGADGIIYWGTNCTPDDTRGRRPLVLIVHGSGHKYTDYEHIQEHLAKNGFIVASVEAGGNNVAYAERIVNWLDYLRFHWSRSYTVDNNVALIGHSRGGEGIFTAARKIAEDWGQEHDINAIIALAPSDRDRDGNEGLERLHQDFSESLFVLYGGKDQDTRSVCVEGSLACGIETEPHTGFTLYDRAGSPWSTEWNPILPPRNKVTKAMVLVDRTDHNQWRDGDQVLVPRSEPEETHEVIARAYFNAFLRWRLRGETEYQRYFTGDWTPRAVAETGAKLRHQYSEGSGRRVLDNFENGDLNQGTQSRVFTGGVGLRAEEVAEPWKLPDYSVPHDQGVLLLEWDRDQNPWDPLPWIRWRLPTGTDEGGRRPRDLRSFSHLSFRVSQLHGSTLNDAWRSARFSVLLRDEDSNSSASVPIDLFNDLDYPHAGFIQWQEAAGTPKQDAFTPVSGLETIRIPLNYFHGVDLANVMDVEIRFDRDRAGSLILDSLEVVPDGPLGGTGLGKDLPVGNLGLQQAEWLNFTYEVPPNARNLEFLTGYGTGDADLYVSYDEAPTQTRYDCRSYRSSNDERCSFSNPSPGTWHVMVRAYRTFSGVTLVAGHDFGNADPRYSELPYGGRQDLELATLGAEMRYWLDVEPGTRELRVSIRSGIYGDADLYLRRGSGPTVDDYDCRPYLNGNEEVCVVQNPLPGRYYVMVRAYRPFWALYVEARAYLGPQEATYTWNANVPIPDNNDQGIETQINVPRTGPFEEFVVQIGIPHTYRGDLYVELEDPEGNVNILKEVDNWDGQNNLYRSFRFPGRDESGGSWILRVSDRLYQDTGYLDYWSLSFF